MSKKLLFLLFVSMGGMHNSSFCMHNEHVNQAREELRSNKLALHQAAYEGNLEKVRLLLTAGAHVDARDDADRTPLYGAAQGGHRTIVELLLQSGAQPNAKTKTGATPLHIAATNNHKETVQILVNHGADLNVKTSQDCSPLFVAAAAGNASIVAYLIEAGATVDTPDFQGMSPLHVALRNGQRHIVPMIRPFCSAHAPDKTGSTPLHYAAYYGYEDIVESLIKSNVALDVQGPLGCTPLFFAVQNGHHHVVRYLLEQGASILLKNEHGATPLHTAAANNRLENVHCLVTESFFMPQYEPALNEQKTPKEKFLIETLVELKNYQALKNSFVKLEPWSAKLIAEQVPLDRQRELMQAWQGQLKTVSKEREDIESDINTYQAARLIAAHCERHLNKIKDALALRTTAGKKAYEVAQQKNYPPMVQLLDHIVQAARFKDLSDDMQTLIMQNISKRLGFFA